MSFVRRHKFSIATLIFLLATAIASYIFLRLNTPLSSTLNNSPSSVSLQRTSPPVPPRGDIDSRPLSPSPGRGVLKTKPAAATAMATFPNLTADERPASVPVTSAITATIYINTKVYETNLALGSSLYNIMRAIPDLDFNGKEFPDMGYFIEEINGIPNNSRDRTYWVYYVNGEPAKIGVSNYIVKPNDIIEWKYGNTNF